METQKQRPLERDRWTERERETRQRDEETDAERLRWTDRRRDERPPEQHPALTELLAGLLGPLCHLGKSRKAPGQKASGPWKLWTSMLKLRCLPHLPFPFLAPSHSLPLYIFKTAKLPQPHPPRPLHRGRRQGPPPVPSGPPPSPRQRGCRGQTTSAWDQKGLGNKPQALGKEPTGLGGSGDLPTAVRGSGQQAGRVQGSLF